MPGRNPVFVVTLSALGVSVALVASCGRPADPPLANTPAPSSRAVTEVQGTGTLESAQSASPGFQVGGRVSRLVVDEGDEVKAGQLLATLDAEEATRQLQVTRANQLVADAAVARATAELDRARATLENTQRESRRSVALFQSATVSAWEHDAADQRLAVAQAEERALGAARLQAERVERAAARSVARDEQRVVELRLLSPFDGVVVRKHREVGDVLPPAAAVLTIASLRRVWVRAWVDETALARLAVGQPARVEFRSHPGAVYPGRVARVGKQADRQTHELLVDVLVERLPDMFALGQRADVRINTGRVTDATPTPTVSTGGPFAPGRGPS